MRAQYKSAVLLTLAFAAAGPIIPLLWGPDEAPAPIRDAVPLGRAVGAGIK